MQLHISDQTGVPVREGMIGLFFEDINYAADGGLYAEMIENRSFESLDCHGKKGDYYTRYDGGYAWEAEGEGRMVFVSGSPLCEENPHYLRFKAFQAGQGFSNRAYDGVTMEKGGRYRVSFYARCASYQGDFQVTVRKDGKTCAGVHIPAVKEEEEALHAWNRYEAVLEAGMDVRGAKFVVELTEEGIVEFDFISLMPCDAVAGIFRKDLFEKLQDLRPGFIRFPGGCIVEGNTLSNRYHFKDTLKKPEERKNNWNRWAVHETNEENGYHSVYAHYNQTLGLGYYEYFLLCELIGAKPLPVLNVGLACQYQSWELVDTDSPEFAAFVQDAYDLIEFANGGVDTHWGRVREQLGHPEPFGLTMVGIGNEQWETDKAHFFERYSIFEKAIHSRYPDIELIGSAGPDITSERYEKAWAYYHKESAEKANFVYAVDEHYYVKPEWLYEHTDFYDAYPRDVKVFSGEYAAHPFNGMNRPDANTLGGALAEAAFLTGVERNADVVVLASYAPLFARLKYAQWSPDMIWFDDKSSYGTPSYYVQQMYACNMGTVTLRMDGQEKALRQQGLYLNVSLDEKSKDIIVKAVNAEGEDKTLPLTYAEGWKTAGTVARTVLSGDTEAWNSITEPEKIVPVRYEEALNDSIELPAHSFTVLRIPTL